MIHEAELSGNVNEEELHERISRLMPHWERAFNLNKQVMMSATLGVLLESVIERLQIGVALLDRQNDSCTATAPSKHRSRACCRRTTLVKFKKPRRRG